MTPPCGNGKLRVVVFTGGAVLQDDCAEFLARLDARPEVALAGVFCESRGSGISGVVSDLWLRRRWLAPLLLLQKSLRWLVSPRRNLARRRLLQKLGPRIHYEPDLHAAPVLEQVASLDPALGAVYGGPILRPELFCIPRKGTLGIHHGRLPHYRGKKTTFWAMYHGEEQVGVAIQRIGAGLDRGDVLREAVLPTGRWPLPVVRRRLELLGLDLYVEAVLAMRGDDMHFRPQDITAGRLYKDPRALDIVRFWWRYLARLLRRGAAPGIGL